MTNFFGQFESSFNSSISHTPVVQLWPNHLWPKRPLMAKLFRESFFTLKFTYGQTQFYNPDFWSDFRNFFYRNGPFLLFGSYFTSFYIETKKIFRFELIKWKIFDFKFVRFDCFCEKFFGDKDHLWPKRPLMAKLFRESYLAITVPAVYIKYIFKIIKII